MILARYFIQVWIGVGDGVVVSPSIWLPARFLIWLNPFPAPSPRQQFSCLLSRFDDRGGKIEDKCVTMMEFVDIMLMIGVLAVIW